MSRTKKVVLRLDASTWRWVRALARANSQTDIHPEAVTVEEILEQAAFCFADAAGRREGSWEASVGQSLLDSSGYQEHVDYSDYDRCYRLDERANAAWRAKWEASK